MTRMAYLSVREVQKSYSGLRGGETLALQRVSLDLEKGDFVAILGPSGCGKSTLLQIVAGLIPPSAGQVLLDGAPITKPPREIVYLFQQYAKSLLPWRTVRQN